MSDDESLIHLHKGGGMTLTGDAIRLFREAALRSSIQLHRDCGMIPTRGMTITRMLESASALTGKKYKGKTKHDDAIRDLTTRIDAAKAAMPVQNDR